MTKKRLDLSHSLTPLENELQETLQSLILPKEQAFPLFDSAIEDFVDKYGTSPFHSIDELLAISSAEASYGKNSQVAIPLDDLIKDILPK